MMAFLSGGNAADVSAVEIALRFHHLSLLKLLSDPAIRVEIGLLIRDVLSLASSDGC